MVVKVGKYEFIQPADDTHVLGYTQDGRFVFHAQVKEKLTREELREYGESVVKLLFKEVIE